MKRSCLAVCLLSLAGTAWHVASSAAAPTFDDAWYLEVSFRLHAALREGLSAFASEWISAFRTKAPLLSLLPLPLYAVFGPAERLAPWVNVPLLAVVLWGCGALAKRLYDDKSGWAAAAACALMPLVYGLSRFYFAETLVTALVVATLALLAQPGAWGPRRAGLLGALLGLGLLAKVTFPAYVLGPLWLKRRELKPWLGRVLVFALPLAGSWYAFNLPYVAGFALSAGFGRIGSHYSGPLAAYAQSLGGDALSWPILAAAAVLLAAGGQAPHRMLVYWVLPPAALLLLGTNREIRYWQPLLPALAVALGAAAARRPRLAALAVLPALAVFCAQTFGLPPLAPLAFNGPPSSGGGWDRGAVVAAAERSGAAVAAVCFEHPRLNANNLSSWAAMTGSPVRFVNLGHAQASVEAALIRLKDKGADRLLTLSPAPADLPHPLNAVNAEVAARAGGRRLASAEPAPGLRVDVLESAAQ